MSSASSQFPSPRRPLRGGESRTRRIEARRSALRRRETIEALEERALLATIPAAVTTAQLDLSGAINRTTSDESSPSIAVSRADANLVSAVWTRHDPGNLGNTPRAIQTTVSGSFSNDGGQTWATFNAAPNRLIDPTTSNPTQPFDYITDASTAFDRDGNMYVLVSEHNADSTAGALVLFKFDVTGGSPQVVDLDPSPFRVGKVIYQWDPSIVNNAPSPGTPQAWDATLAVDDNVRSFADPSDPTFTQDDPFSGNVYVAWTAYDPSIDAGISPRAYALVATASSDGGNTFKNPTVIASGGVRTPRISISQGRPAIPSQGLAAIPGGTVSFTWDDYFSGRNAVPPQSIIWNQHANAVLVEQFAGIGGPIADAPDASSVGVTDFPLTINFADGRITSLDQLDVSVSIDHAGITELQLELIPPAGSNLQPILLMAPGAASGAGLGFPTAAQGSLGTVFSNSAAISIVGNTGGGNSIGYFRPQGNLGVISGKTAAELSGQWILRVTDITTSNNPPPQSVVSWGLKFSAGLRRGVTTSATDPTQPSTPASAALAVDTSTIRGEDPGTAIPTQTNSNPLGILPSPVIAVDNTLGAFSPNIGRTYIAYVDRYNILRDNPLGNGNPDDNTDIRLRVVDLVQTPFGPRWQVIQGAGSNKVNDDAGLIDGATQSVVSNSLTTGRPQYEPQVAVDPTTGTLVMSWLDARDDAGGARVATYLTTSIDGGRTFSDQTFANATQAPYDGTLRRTIGLGPVVENQTPGNPNTEATYGFGGRQGLAVYAGRVYPAWSGNANGGSDGQQRLDINVGLTEIAAGPRVIASTMGPVGGQSVIRLSDGARVDFNNLTDANGTPIADGFVVTFDRPIDPGTFGVGDIRVFYRSPDTPGTAPGTPLNPLEVIPLQSGNTPQGPTQFLVRFEGSSAVGTYSYSIGPDISDRMRAPLSTQIYYAPRTEQNLPAIVDNSTVSSTLDVSVPSDQELVDVNVKLSLRHTRTSDLTIRLVPPPGLNLQPITLVAKRGGAGVDFLDTTFDEQATTPIAFGAAPFTGSFQTETGGLSTLDGLNPSGTWTLQIVDDKPTDTGDLIGWGLVLTTRTTSASPAQLGNLMDQNANALQGETPAGSTIVSPVPGDIYAAPMPDPRRPDQPVTPRVYGGSPNLADNPLDFGPPFAEATLPLQVAGPKLTNTYTYTALGDQREVEVPDGQLQPNLSTVPGVATSTITVGGDPNLQVADLNVSVDLSYASAQDLQLYLVAPDGFEIPLVLNATGAGFDGTTFDDQAAASVYNAPGGAARRFIGRFQPDTALTNMAGRTLKGTWTLRVEDTVQDTAPLARAVIHSWSMKAQATTVFRDAAADRITIRFDRDMDPTSLVTGNHILSLVGPGGPISGPFKVVAAPNLDPNYPDPDPLHPRTYQVILPTPSPVVGGQYVARLAPDVRSETGEALDTNQNAGLDNLRGTPSQGTDPVTYFSPAPVPITASPAGTTFVSAIQVDDSFLVKNAVVQINVVYPDARQLTAVLVAPDGTEVQLFSKLKVAGANFSDTIFDDAAPTPITNAGPPYSGRFAPQPGLGLTLGNLVDKSAQGRWELRVTVEAPNLTGRIASWQLTLAQPISNSGLGEPVADRADLGFRVFTMDPTNPVSSNTWTAVGPAGAGAKGPNLNAEVAGRVNRVTVDPSDPTGNTAFAAGASGGVWKTTNLLTSDPTGPTWVPLLDNQAVFAMNVGDIAVVPRNGDPNQTAVFVATGDANATGDASGLARPASLTTRGVGFLRSLDGGRTWTLLDSLDNTTATDARDHFFASVPGQAGTTTFRLIADPNPVQTDTSRLILFAAVSDINAQGQAVTSGPKGGIYRSTDSGNTWTRVRGGQATDVVFDPNSQAAPLGDRPGNLQFLYAAFRGDGVYFSPNQGDVFNPVLGTTGNPLIQNADGPQPLPVPVSNPSVPPTPNSTGLPLGQIANGGRIVLAKPAPTGNVLQDLIYRGWVYAAVVQNLDVQSAPTSDFIGLYLTKDFGQNWTKIDLPAFNGFLPSNAPGNGADYTITGNGTLLGSPFHLGNFNLSLAVDPVNPNVVYLGGTDEFQSSGLIRVDATGLHDPHAFFLDNLGDNGGVLAATATTGTGVTLTNPLNGIPLFQPPWDPRSNPFLNLIRDPLNPFAAGATILVTNTASFVNDGAGAKWTPFDQALAPDPFANPLTDPWAIPTRGVHDITTLRDPLTGLSRLIFSTDQGIYSVVADRSGNLVGSLGGVSSTADPTGDLKVVNGSRNGNLQVAQLYAGAAQPSQLSAQLAVLKGYFYGSTEDVGTPFSNPDVINTSGGGVGYGNISWAGGVDRGPSRGGIATRQELILNGQGTPTSGGDVYYWRSSEGLLSVDQRPSTDTWQVNGIGRTFNLYQTSNQGDTPDTQWPLRPGYTFAVNPINGNQAVIGSQAGRVFATRDSGLVWAEIGNPGALDGSKPTALAFGAPNPDVTDVLQLDDYVLVGTQNGNVFVTFTGGGTGGGAGNAWRSLGSPDGSPIRSIVAEPTRGSKRIYVTTELGVYRMDNTQTNSGWANRTGNLPLPKSATDFNTPLAQLASLAADWRYVIPDNFGQPDGPSHPVLYVGGQGGVWRSLDDGNTWAPFPDSGAGSLLASPLGDGGGLPNSMVTDLDLALGNIDPQTGRPNSIDPKNPPASLADSLGPNVLVASTYGRGQYTIRLAPIVFPNQQGQPRILGIDSSTDSGLSNTDQVTNITDPIVDGFSEQTAFGNLVRITLYDMTDGTPRYIGGYDPSNPGATDIPDNRTGPEGRFSVRINAGALTTDGVKTIGVVATNISGTRGNLATFQFTLDTVAPDPAQQPVLLPGDDTGLRSDDQITNPNLLTVPNNGQLRFDVTFTADPTGADTQATLYRGAAIAGPAVLAANTARLTDVGPITPDGVYDYKVKLVDLAGNESDFSVPLNVRVDTTRPAKPQRPSLEDASNSGSTSDNITNVRQPYFTGTAEPNAFANPNDASVTQQNRVDLIDSAGNVIGTGVVAANGVYRVQPSAPLANGTYTFRVRLTDVAGNVGDLSDSLTVIINSQQLNTPTLRLVAEDDSGVVGDNITNVKRPRLQGTAQPGLTVQIINDQGTVLLPAPGAPPIVVNDAGTYLTQFASDLPDGVYLLRARVSDVAGNTADSAELRLTIQTASDVGPSPQLILSPAVDTGTPGDNVTTRRRVTFQNRGTVTPGTLPPSITQVALFRAGQTPTFANEQARAPVAPDGSFLLPLPQDLVNGTISVVAYWVDVAGNYVNQSDALTIRVTTADGDFNNNSTATADLGIYSRNNPAQWVAAGYVDVNGSGSYTVPNPPGFIDGAFGPAGGGSMVPFQGDFNGDGRTDTGVFDYRTATFYIRERLIDGRTVDRTVQFGWPGVALPVPADYDGDGKTDLAVYQPNQALWIIQYSSGGALFRNFGQPNRDQAVPADYNGDGKADLMIYQPDTATWQGLFSTPSANAGANGSTAFGPLRFGWPGVDRAAPADYNGDGKVDLGLFRPISTADTNGQTRFLATSIVPNMSFTLDLKMGQPGDTPVILDFNGDGIADPAVFRPSTTQWFLSRSTRDAGAPGGIARSVPTAATRSFGPPGGIPLGAPLYPYRLPVGSPTTSPSSPGGVSAFSAASTGGAGGVRAFSLGSAAPVVPAASASMPAAGGGLTATSPGSGGASTLGATASGSIREGLTRRQALIRRLAARNPRRPVAPPPASRTTPPPQVIRPTASLALAMLRRRGPFA